MSDEKIYHMTQQDYNALLGHLQQIQKILSRAVVVDAPAPAPSPLSNTVPTTLQHLNSATLPEVFGINYRGILYYDLQTNAWSANTYGGYSVRLPIHSDEISSTISDATRNQSGDITQAFALAVMTISHAFFQGWCEPVNQPVFSPRGTSIVANLVYRDKNTGKIIPVSSKWVGIADASDHHSAVMRCFAVPDLLTTRSVLLQTLLETSRPAK